MTGYHFIHQEPKDHSKRCIASQCEKRKSELVTPVNEEENKTKSCKNKDDQGSIFFQEINIDTTQ
jgi:hypothetical protein